MPSGDVVRSLIRPKNGLATMASRAPTAATSARLAGARWFPTSESTFKAKVTSRGARNSRLVLMYASVYSEMKPHPTLRAAGEEGSSAASAAVRLPTAPADCLGILIRCPGGTHSPARPALRSLGQ